MSRLRLFPDLRIDLSPTGHGRVWVTMVLVTVGFIVLAFALDSLNWAQLDDAGRLRHILIDIFVPILVSGPIMYFLMDRMRQLAIAHRELEIVASTDSLTTVLNRGAFMTLVDAYLAKVSDEQQHGALLVVDADNFKAINDRFGHDRGDEALKLIASAIKGMLRGADLVGRIGGEEFGVFLPGSNREQAETVAERIRLGVASSVFMPDGSRRELSVSVGGAVFERHLDFSDLFRVADQQLYLAKSRGRNRTAVAAITGYGGLPMAAA